MNTYERSGANMNTYEMSGANIAGEERSSNWYPVHAPVYTSIILKITINTIFTQTKGNKKFYMCVCGGGHIGSHAVGSMCTLNLEVQRQEKSSILVLYISSQEQRICACLIINFFKNCP